MRCALALAFSIVACGGRWGHEGVEFSPGHDYTRELTSPHDCLADAGFRKLSGAPRDLSNVAPIVVERREDQPVYLVLRLESGARWNEGTIRNGVWFSYGPPSKLVVGHPRETCAGGTRAYLAPSGATRDEVSFKRGASDSASLGTGSASLEVWERAVVDAGAD